MSPTPHFEYERGQSSTGQLAVVAIVVVAALAVGVYVTGGIPTDVVDSPSNSPMPTAKATQTPTATVAGTPTPTLTPTPTATPIPTVTSTPVTTPNSRQYRPFMSRFVYWMEHISAEKNVPLRLKGSRVIDQDLWIVIDIKDTSGPDNVQGNQIETLFDAWLSTSRDYSDGGVRGERPTGFRIIETNDSLNRKPYMIDMNQSVTEAAVEGDKDYDWAVSATKSEVQVQSERQRKIRQEINQNGRNLTITPE